MSQATTEATLCLTADKGKIAGDQQDGANQRPEQEASVNSPVGQTQSVIQHDFIVSVPVTLSNPREIVLVILLVLEFQAHSEIVDLDPRRTDASSFR